jgi:energy-coupling factor transport system ATP-binding protein
MGKIIEFKDYTFTYLGSTVPSLKEINLDIEEGSAVGIVGPAGSGKSTLLLSLNGIPEEIPGIQKGDVIVDGLNTKECEMFELAKHVGIVLDNPTTQLIALTVIDDIAFGPSNLGLPMNEIQNRIEFAIDAARLKGFERRNPNELSGGEQQSLAIAGILAMRPKVLAMNEPVAMLDPIGKQRVFSVINTITKEFKTTSIISESGVDIESIAGYLDRIIIIHNGEIQMDDTPRKVLENEIVERLGIGRPQVTDLFLRLRKELKDVPVPINLGEAVEFLKEEFKKGRLKPLKEQPEERKVEKIGEPVVRIRNLHHEYPGGVEALKGVSFDIYDGEIVGLIGQNGSGKTTLSFHLVGVLKPTNPDAEVMVSGQNVIKGSIGDAIKYTNYVYQNPENQLFQETVKEEIAYGLKLRDLPQEEIDKKVKDVLDFFKIQAYKEEYIMFLPRDIKTFVSIASLMVLDPKVLIIDEPTTGLDRNKSEEMMNILMEFRKAGHTLILISHNMELVAKYCQRVIVMKEGKVLLDGTAREVFSKHEILAQSNIKPPQITMLSQEMHKLGFPQEFLTVDEAFDVLVKALKRRS